MSLRSVAVTVGAACVLIGLAPAAQAHPGPESGDRHSCVVGSEFNQIDTDMSRTRIERIIDTHGHRASPAAMWPYTTGAYGHVAVRPPRKFRYDRTYPACVKADGSVASGFLLVEYDRRTQLATAEHFQTFSGPTPELLAR